MHVWGSNMHVRHGGGGVIGKLNIASLKLVCVFLDPAAHQKAIYQPPPPPPYIYFRPGMDPVGDPLWGPSKIFNLTTVPAPPTKCY